jgi:hypothetical protein
VRHALHLRRQADLCLRLANATDDPALAENLRLMAADLQEMAEEAEDDAPFIPNYMIGKDGSGTGESDNG